MTLAAVARHAPALRRLSISTSAGAEGGGRGECFSQAGFEALASGCSLLHFVLAYGRVQGVGASCHDGDARRTVRRDLLDVFKSRCPAFAKALPDVSTSGVPGNGDSRGWALLF